MRTRSFAAAIGLLGALWLAPGASAETTTIGTVAPSAAALSSACLGCSWAQVNTDPASPSYVVPAPPASGDTWTLTSWTTRGGPGDGSASVEVWRHTATPDELELIAIGPEQPIAMDTEVTNPVSIPVLPGDVLGVRSGGDTDYLPTYTSSLSNDVSWLAIGDPAVGQTMSPMAPPSDFAVTGSSSLRVNALATLSSTPPSTTPTTPQTTPTTPGPRRKKCKKKHRRSAESAKKKKCKRRKKR
jgi:hypothetical protein